MSPFTIKIDEKKCNSCGLCVRDCISGCLTSNDDRPVVNRPEWCSLCSHCLAICPKGAIEHSGLTGWPPQPVGSEKLDQKMYKRTVMTRRSIRQFKDIDVHRKDIEDIIALASYSPTASNSRDVSYIVISDKKQIRNIGMSIFKKFEKIMKFFKNPPGSFLTFLINLIASKNTVNRYLDRYEFFTNWVKNGRDIITHDAPVLILILGPKKSRFARENSAIAACNITNYANTKGLGTCYIGLINVALDLNRKLSKSLGVPKGKKAYLALVMGYQAYKFQNTPVRPEPTINWVNS